MLGNLIYVFITGSALFVYYDATQHKIGEVPDERGLTNTTAGAWAVETLLLWIIVFPIYLSNRTRLIERAKVKPQEPSRYKVIAFLVLGFLFILCLYLLFHGISNREVSY